MNTAERKALRKSMEAIMRTDKTPEYEANEPDANGRRPQSPVASWRTPREIAELVLRGMGE